MPPAPKPAHLRQRTNRKIGAGTITAPINPQIPDIPNTDGREWHIETIEWWKCVWESPMSSRYLPSDVRGLGRVAALVDEFNKKPSVKILSEIRQQEQRFGLSPLDRMRLQWEIVKTEEAETRHAKTKEVSTETRDPRKVLKAV